MLFSLHIENIAVIRSIDIDFSCGFTALTGETGAGKSIIIDSIGLLLGRKADRELIRTGEDRAMVSGLFGDLSPECLNLLGELGVSLDDEGEIMIQRQISADGRSVVRINGRTVSLSILKSIAPMLIGIHGQNDTTSLTDPERHLEILDTYARVDKLLVDYRRAYEEYSEVRRKRRDLEEKIRQGERMKEILEYQINDIDALSLHDGEEEELVEKKVRIRNSEKIIKNSEFVYRALKGSEKGSVYYLLDRCTAALSQLSAVLPEYDGYTEVLRDILYKVDDIAEEVADKIDLVDEDPTETLNSIEERLDKISKLKRKYGLTVADILAFSEKAKAELSLLVNSDGELARLDKEECRLYGICEELAKGRHDACVLAAGELERGVNETLAFLDMPKVVFFANIKEMIDGEKRLLSKNGYDTAQFYISANRGAEPQPLSKIASGGELARVMLALKGEIADKDGVLTVIYDEIDAGVSGKTARKIGIKMLKLSKSTQIFCVTHSAQIASLADTHLLISKSDVGGATETTVKALDEAGRIDEISRILGGINITESQREAAEDMILEKEQYI